MKKAPRRDLIEILRPIDEAPRGQRFRIWINGKEATSVLQVRGEREIKSFVGWNDAATKIAAGPLELTVTFALPRFRIITKPPRKANRRKPGNEN